MCREPDALTNVVLDKSVQRKVNSLEVRCSNYKEGCEWVGELRDLYNHLDPAKGIACRFGYGKHVRRSEMKEHTYTSKYNQLIVCRSAYV